MRIVMELPKGAQPYLITAIMTVILIIATLYPVPVIQEWAVNWALATEVLTVKLLQATTAKIEMIILVHLISV